MDRRVKLNGFIALSTFTLLIAACGTATPEDSLSNDSDQVTDESVSTSSSECGPVETEHILLQFPDVIEMELLTAASGGGERPLLEWEPVEGADSYGLVLFDPEGEPYWAWLGYDTSIYVTGLSEPPPVNSEGPIVVPCMTWTTTAYDSSGEPIAAGGPRSISP
jgi:hypothetical protein